MMKLKNSLLTFAVILLPLDESSFKVLKYNKITPSKVKWQNGVSIEVDNSANPIFYFLKKPMNAAKVIIKGTIVADNIPKDLNQKDDYLLRVAPIYEGKNKFGMMQRMFAADWLIELYKEASKITSQGIDNIDFYAIGDKEKLGSKIENEYFGLKINTHFSSIVEKNSFSLGITTKENRNLLGFWISSDGDGSKGKFTTNINQIQIETKE